MIRSAVLLATLGLTAQTLTAEPVTYQGSLRDGGAPATGDYDLRFRLYDASVGGAQTGPQLEFASTAIQGGLFTLQLDFGDVFDETPLFLEIDVRQGADPYTTLASRQPVTPAPVAQYALSGSISGITGGAIEVVGQDVFMPSSLTIGLDGLFGRDLEVGLDATFGGNLIAGLDATIGGNLIAGGNADIAEQLSVGGDVFLFQGLELPNASASITVGDPNEHNLFIDGFGVAARDGADHATISLNFQGGNVFLGSSSALVYARGDLRVDGELITPPRTKSRIYSPFSFTDRGGGLSIGLVSNRPNISWLSCCSRATMPIDLPDGATITAVSAIVQDSSATANITIELHRKLFGSAARVIEASATTSGTPGDTLLEFVTNTTLDRANNSYYLNVQATDTIGAGSIRLWELEIQYTTETIE